MPRALATAYFASARISGRTVASTRDDTVLAGSMPSSRRFTSALRLIAEFRAPRVRDEPFAARERRRDRTEGARRGGGEPEQRRALLEVVHAERRREARRASRRQHVIGPGAVVAERLGGVVAHEDRTGVPDLR